MKKMLLAFAVMACAVVAQAITLNWTTASANTWVTGSMACSLIYSDSGTSLEEAAQVAWSNASTTDYTIIGRDDSNPTVTGGDYNMGAIATTNSAYTPVTTGTYFIIFTEGNNYYATSVTAADATSAWTPETGTIPETYTGAVTVADFTSGTVPEPTALALLALGVAGLALRRRA